MSDVITLKRSCEAPIFDFTLSDKAPEGYFTGAMGWYLHGKLDSLAGGDLCATSTDPRAYEDGIYPATCLGHECTFYFWSYYMGDHRKFRGLVVLNSDMKSRIYAQKQFDLQKANL